VHCVYPRVGEYARVGEWEEFFIVGTEIAIAIVCVAVVCPHVTYDVSFAVAVHQVIGRLTWVVGKETNLKRLSRSDPMKFLASFHIAGLETWGNCE
jgi:hypothetical protein